MFFYLCFPWLFKGIQARWYIVTGVSAAVLGMLLWMCHALSLPEVVPGHLCEKGLIYIYPLSRVFEFIMGMLAAVLFRRYSQHVRISLIQATVLELAAFGAVFFINTHSAAWSAASLPYASFAGSLWLKNCGFTLLPFALAIAILSIERGLISSVLRLPLLVRLGNASFGIFALHAVFLNYHTAHFPQHVSLSMSLIYLAAVIVAGDLLWVVVEKPARKAMLHVGNRLLSLRWKTPPQAVGPWIGTAYNAWMRISPKSLLWVAIEAIVLIFLLASLWTTGPSPV